MNLRRFLAGAGVPVVFAATLATSSALGARSGDAVDSPLLEPAPAPAAAPSTIADVLPPKVAVRPKLPVPEPPPADPYEDVPVVQVGTISIPAIGLEHPLYEGVWLTVIDHGPGHWPGSALPGERGNTVFPGHRVTHSRPFYDLDLLEPGDEVVFRTADGEFTYAVTGTQIVVPTDMWVIDPTEEPTMTLIACHPKHSARQRIVVKGDLIRSVPAASSAARAA